MEDHRGESIILVELDALLDTRLPTLGAISPEAGLACAGDRRYFNRVIDDFEEICGISKEDFRAAYAKRDLEIVQNATMTEMPYILHDLVRKLEQESIDTPFLSRVIVEVNTYPYDFDSETRDTLALAVMYRCGIETEVRCIRMAPEQITPALVKERYSGMILYNFRDWMEHHLEGFKTTKMPRVSILAPALYYDTVPAAGTFVEDGIAPHINAFQLSEIGCVELFSLSLLPATNFSLARIPGHYRPKNSEQNPDASAPALSEAPKTYTVR